jgi:large conductance mechanosensitive channel
MITGVPSAHIGCPFPEVSAVDPRNRVLTLAEEFKAFALKGNVIDMAVGIVIGAAFTQIVTSLVSNIIMPAINIFAPTSHASYTGWHVIVNGSEIPYGKFIGDIVNFFVISIAMFLLIRVFLNWLLTLHKHQAAAAETPPLTKDQQLLTEIRNLLSGQPPTSPAAPAPGPTP